MPAPDRWSKRTRNVMWGSVLIPSYGRSSRFGHEADTSLPRQPAPNVPMTSVFAGHRFGGAPRRNRTGDPILTIDARVVDTAVQHLELPHIPTGERDCRGLGRR